MPSHVGGLCGVLSLLVMAGLKLPQTAASGRSIPAHDCYVFLLAGKAAASFGVHCAQLAGVRPDVLRRAIAVIQAQGQVRVRRVTRPSNLLTQSSVQIFMKINLDCFGSCSTA